MSDLLKCSALVAAIASTATLTGCGPTNAQFLASEQPDAINVGVHRGRFEMNCPQATASVLSSEVVQPVIQNPRFGGVQRAEFTVGVEGCGQRATYLVVCPQGGSGCFAAGARNIIR